MVHERAVPGSRRSWVDARPYAPSWVDVLQDAVERLPWPPWLTYLGVGLALAGTETALKWSTGTYPVGTVFPYHIVAAATGVYGLALIHYLDANVGWALDAFRPTLNLSDAEVAVVRRRLATMPAGPAWCATLVGIAVGVLQRWVIVAPNIERFHYAESGPVHVFEVVAISLVGWAVIALFVYHTVRQLGIIDALYRTAATSFDLFHVRPLYAFSAMSARTALGLFAILFIWIVVYPRGVDASVTRLLAGTELTLFALIFATFLAPLWGAHQRLAAERGRRLEEVRARLRVVLDELAESVSRRDFAAVDGISKAMAGVTTELTMVERASTWPWHAATLRGFLTAVLLPLLVWSLQQVLARSLLG